jgi:hypothetical protein
MNVPARGNSLQSYQVVVYDRALHPELFSLKGRKVVKHGKYELEAWIMCGQHVLRFESGPVCASELLTDQDRNLPATGVVTAFLCAGERDFEHRFRAVTYMNTVQTETLSENLYSNTFDEMIQFGKESRSLMHEWSDDSGRCASILDIQRYQTQVHAQSYHLIATQGIVVRTQTIFEQR